MSIRAKKTLGQNFLRSKSAIRTIVVSAGIKNGEVVLEIGPGKGILTKALLEAGATVIAVEKDNRLIPLLEETFKTEIENGRLCLIHGDILEMFPNIPLISPSNYKVVANIPYYISGALLKLLLGSKKQPQLMVLMLQKEVAKRIVAKDSKESILSMSVKVYGTPKYIETIKKESFSPQPKVDSAILLIKDISKDFFKNEEEENTFFEIIKKTFGQKRKTLNHTLTKTLGIDTEALNQNTPLDLRRRPETLSKDEWKILVNACANLHHHP